jgi:hypothetical protein
MRARTLLLAALATGLLISGCSKQSAQTTAKLKKSQYPKADAPQVIDYAPYYKGTPGKPVGGFSRRKVFDGLPFHVDCKITLYGQTQVNSDNRGNPDGDAGANYPDLTGVPVNRKFAELHVLHTTSWPDVDGETIAVIRLHYADDTSHEFPIIYGAHVRDGHRNRTEESETLSDPDSKIVWRGPGNPSLKTTLRVFESKFINPYPLTVVKTLDVVSTRHMAGYQLYAMTVADFDPHRAVSSPVPSDEPERHFGDQLTVQVRDEATGQPISGALVEPAMDVDGPYMVAAPFYTGETGEGVIRYPKSRTTHISVEVAMKGYANGSANWVDDFPATNTIQLTPTPAP